MNLLTHCKQTILPLLVTIAFACFALLFTAQAVVPPPDGGYRGGNTAEGQEALFSLTTGRSNTAVGCYSLFAITDGFFNTGIGAKTLIANTGDNNTATGASALSSNTEGSGNTANGAFALLSNTEGVQNTATGLSALQNNTLGQANVANGWFALGSNTVGEFNTAVGWDALGSNTTGVGNTALGFGALFTNTTGNNNIALGDFSGKGVTIASNVICIGSLGADVDNSTWIANVYGVTTQSGTTAPVVVSDGGQLGTVVSSQRFKKDIAAMERVSEVILSLRPVTFHYKSDAKEAPQFGLIAEEVAKVNPALVLPDKEGKPYTVRYDAVNAMLLNEFLKEHRKVEKLEAALRAVNERLAEQDAKIQKVSAQVEVSKFAPQTVVNNR
jgi:Chaperone of endosialidase